jgi:hypothetical protein
MIGNSQGTLIGQHFQVRAENRPECALGTDQRKSGLFVTTAFKLKTERDVDAIHEFIDGSRCKSVPFDLAEHEFGPVPLVVTAGIIHRGIVQVSIIDLKRRAMTGGETIQTILEGKTGIDGTGPILIDLESVAGFVFHVCGLCSGIIIQITLDQHLPVRCNRRYASQYDYGARDKDEKPLHMGESLDD